MHLSNVDCAGVGVRTHLSNVDRATLVGGTCISRVDRVGVGVCTSLMWTVLWGGTYTPL